MTIKLSKSRFVAGCQWQWLWQLSYKPNCTKFPRRSATHRQSRTLYGNAGMRQ